MTASTSTSWDKIASEHVGHRGVLRDAHTLECVDCNRKLLIPKNTAVTTSIPAPYQRTDSPGVPMPTGFKDRVMAEIRARRDMKQPEA